MVDKQRWTWREEPRKFALLVLAFILAGALIAAGWAFVVDRAYGADKVPPSSSSTTIQRCVTDSGAACDAPTKRDRRAARKFRNGKIHRSGGFRPARVFKQPRAARRIMVTKIRRVLERADANARPNTKGGHNPYEGCTSRGCALEAYMELVKNAGCADRGGPYPIDVGTCRYPTGNSVKLTKKQVQAGGTAVLCSGGVIFGVVASPASGGSTAFAAFWGATSCGWTLWAMLDD